MCRTTLHKSSTCTHSWFTLERACGPDLNFSNCTTFTDAKYRRHLCSGPTTHHANKCPECDGKGKYDGNVLRMVALVEFTWTSDPNATRITVEDGEGAKVICREIVMVQNPNAPQIPGIACCVM